MELHKIGYNIKVFREQNHLTQELLATKINHSRSTIAKWENNTLVPDVESLIKLSDFFNVTLDQLTGRHSYMDDIVRDFKRIYQLDKDTYDKNFIDLIEYAMTHPEFKNEILRLKSLPLKQQKYIHETLKFLINQQTKLL